MRPPIRLGSQPATLSRLVVFLVATLTTTWLAFLPMIMGLVDKDLGRGLVFLLLVGIGAPSITAFVLSAAHDGSGRGASAGAWRHPVAGPRPAGTWRSWRFPALAFGGSWAVGCRHRRPDRDSIPWSRR